MIDEPVIISHCIELYNQGAFDQAYDLLTNSQEVSPLWMSRVFEIRMDLAAVMGKLDLAEEILEQSLQKGYFYNETVLREDGDVKPLQGRPRYEILVNRCLEKLAFARKRAKPELHILEPVDIPASGAPLFIGLHGNNSNAVIYSQSWGSLQQDNWLVALPQSSQVSAKGLYVWNDPVRMEKEIVDHFTCINRCYPIDEKHILFNGFSRGGFAALLCTLKQRIPAKGYLGLAPYIADPETLLPLVRRLEYPFPRFYFVLGELDADCNPGALKTIDLLQRFGVECEVETISGMAHAIPEHFCDLVGRAFRFLLN